MGSFTYSDISSTFLAKVVRFNERQQRIALLYDGFNASRHLVPAIFS